MGKGIINYDAATTNELLAYVKKIKDGGGINLDAPKDGNLYGQKDGEWEQAQEKLVEGENIKTINGVSVLGSGNVDVAPTIGENGNWYINGKDTGKPSKGTDGKNGADGVSLGEIALVQDFSSPNEESVPSTQAVKDLVSTSGGNKTLTWNTDAATTRKQVPLKDRKELLIISYKNADGNTVNEQYIGTETTDTEWGKDENWTSFSMSENEVGNNYLPGELSNFISGSFIDLSGKVKKGSSTEYYTPFLKLKKGDRIVVFTKVKSNIANALSFYTQKNEESFVEGVNNIDAEHLPAFNSRFPNNFSKVEYTATQDGYVRVSFMNFACDYEQYIDSKLPAIYTGDYYDKMMQEMSLYEDYESEGEPEGHFLGYINSIGSINKTSTETDWLIFKFVPKGCKFKCITSQDNNCLAIFEEFTNQQYMSKLISSDSNNIAKVEFTADKNTWIYS